MESLKSKIIANKELRDLMNYSSLIDQTYIKFQGNNKHKYSKILESSLKKSLALDSKINNEIKEMNGLSGRKYRYMINNIIALMKSSKYLEIGSWLGSTACSAIFKNKLKITCIDNWSEFLKTVDNPEEIFKKNINKYINKKVDFNFYNNDFRKIDYKKIGEFNIFLYDGPHNLKDHIDGILMPQPALENEYILIVDDWNWKQVREGTLNAINTLNLNVIAQLEIRTTIDDTNAIINGKFSDWHQGYSFFVMKKN